VSEVSEQVSAAQRELHDVEARCAVKLSLYDDNMQDHEKKLSDLSARADAYQHSLSDASKKLNEYATVVTRQSKVIKSLSHGRTVTDMTVDGTLCLLIYLLVHKIFLPSWVNKTVSGSLVGMYFAFSDKNRLQWSHRTLARRKKYAYWMFFFIEALFMHKYLRAWAVKRGAHSGHSDLWSYVQLSLDYAAKWAGVGKQEVETETAATDDESSLLGRTVGAVGTGVGLVAGAVGALTKTVLGDWSTPTNNPPTGGSSREAGSSVAEKPTSPVLSTPAKPSAPPTFSPFR
jgi:hypothetical protein